MLLADSDSTNGFTAICLTFIIFGLPVVMWFCTRYMNYRERMAMIQSGLNPYAHMPSGYAPPNPGQPGPYVAPPYQTGYDPRMSRKAQKRYEREMRKNCDKTPEGQLRGGIVTAFVGLALTIGLSFIGLDDGVFRPGPWLLGGLIPLFVGLSQIMNGVLSGASFGSFNRGRNDNPQQPPPWGPQPGAAPGYGANGNGATPNSGTPNAGTAQGPYDAYSYTYRPGVPEIEPPSRPPERR